MSRQDANAAFALTSFLYGGNAAYVEDLHARYLADPTSVDAQWQAFRSTRSGGGQRVWVTKLTAEHLVRVKAERAGVPFAIARIFNIVGPGQTESHACGRFASQLASLADAQGGTLEVGSLDGKNVLPMYTAKNA